MDNLKDDSPKSIGEETGVQIMVAFLKTTWMMIYRSQYVNRLEDDSSKPICDQPRGGFIEILEN